MDSLVTTITISGTHDGQTYLTTASYNANVRSVSKFSRDLSSSFDQIYQSPGAIVIAIIENTGTDDAYVFLGRISTIVPAGRTIVINGSTGVDSSGVTMYAGSAIEAKSRTSAGTRINCIIAY